MRALRGLRQARWAKYVLPATAFVAAALLPFFRPPLDGFYVVDWTRAANLIAPLRRIHAVRAKYRELLADASPGTIIPLETTNRAITGYLRQQPGRNKALAVLGNTDWQHPQPLTLPHPGARRDLLTNGPVPAILQPGQVVVYALG